MKSFLTVAEQVDLLEERGLDIGSRDHAEACLRRIGYYRLSGYWFPMRARAVDSTHGVTILDTFDPGASLADVLDLYEFDRALRLLVLDAIERVEVAVRFAVGHRLGARGAFAHSDPEVLDADFAGGAIDGPPAIARWTQTDHARWLALRRREEERSKADFVKHFRSKYGLPLPVWVVTEVLDFGGLSWLFGGMDQRDRDAVAADFGVLDASQAGHGGAFKDWLKNLTYIRNVCAHHARLWNVNVIERVSPRLLRPVPDLTHIVDAGGSATSRVYATLAILALLTRRVDPGDDWSDRLSTFVQADLPAGRSLREMGFPARWHEERLWKR